MSTEAPKPEKSLGLEIVNRFIAGVIALMILFFGVPMAVAGVDALAAGFAGGVVTLWMGGVLLIGAVLIVLGLGMLWLAVRPPYGAGSGGADGAAS